MPTCKLNVDFIGIGAQKAATTWLSDQFSGHHQVWVPPVKELQFFNEFFNPSGFKWCDAHRKEHALRVIRNQASLDMPNWNRLRCAMHIASDQISFDWYNEVFSYAKEGQVKGEITPEYSLLSESGIAEIANVSPDLKIILIARSPFDRACSQVKMNLSRINYNQLAHDEKVVEAQKQFDFWDVKERGNYTEIQNKWVKYFGEDRFLLLDYRDVGSQPKSVLDKVSMFLGIDPEAYKVEADKVIHQGQKIKVPDEVVERARPLFDEVNDKYEALFA